MVATAQELERAWQSDQRPSRARLLSVLYALGGALCLLVVVIRQNPAARYDLIGIFGVVGLTVAVFLLFYGSRLPVIALSLGVACYSLLVGVIAAVAVTAVGVLGMAPAVIGTAMFNGYFASRRSLGWQLGLGVSAYSLGAWLSGTSPLLMGLVPAVLVAVAGGLILHRLTDGLRRSGSTDPLTGVLNRAWTLKILEREVGRPHRGPLAVVLIDMDHFKAVNDEHGHLAGDALLAEIADAWTAELGTVGLLGRFGGDEFLVVLPNTQIGPAAEVVRRLRHVHPAAWSAGIAHSVPGDQLSSLLGRADNDLLNAKRSRTC